MFLAKFYKDGCILCRRKLRICPFLKSVGQTFGLCPELYNQLSCMLPKGTADNIHLIAIFDEYFQDKFGRFEQ